MNRVVSTDAMDGLPSNELNAEHWNPNGKMYKTNNIRTYAEYNSYIIHRTSHITGSSINGNLNMKQIFQHYHHPLQSITHTTHYTLGGYRFSILAPWARKWKIMFVFLFQCLEALMADGWWQKYIVLYSHFESKFKSFYDISRALCFIFRSSRWRESNQKNETQKISSFRYVCVFMDCGWFHNVKFLLFCFSLIQTSPIPFIIYYYSYYSSNVQCSSTLFVAFVVR